MVERRFFKNFDFGLVLLMLVITLYGLAVIYSASKGGASGASYVHRQLMWAIAGLVAFAIGASIDHKSYPRMSGTLYVVNLILLLSVLVIGRESKGAQRWLGFGGMAVQPSEFAKVIIVITLAVFLVRRQDRIWELRTFALSFLHVAVPMLLIFKQPDLGTALVLTAIWFGMLFIAGAQKRHLIGFVVLVMLVGTLGWYSPHILKSYQKARLASFINPAVDPAGSGYHVLQSRIAIGSGQFLGRGYLHGTQGRLGFIPERHTDFIFTVVAEELGFVGAGFLLLLYFLLIWKAVTIMSETEDAVGRLAAAGISCMFLFHIVVNVGMTLGIMPVTGVPLPFMSYGGSSLLANMLALGLLTGIGMRRHKINF